MVLQKETYKPTIQEICLNIVKLDLIKHDCCGWLNKMLEYVSLLNAC